MEVVLVTCGLLIKDGKVLCAQRSESMHLSGLWEFPGGKIEEGESPESCLVRELKEELAISVKVVFPLRPNQHAYSEKKVIRLIPFVCTWESGEISLIEHREVKWLPKEDLKTLDWAPADIPIVDELLGNWNKIQKQLVDFNREK